MLKKVFNTLLVMLLISTSLITVKLDSNIVDIASANSNPNPTIVDYYFKVRPNSTSFRTDYSGHYGLHSEDYGEIADANLVVRVNQQNNSVKLTSDIVHLNYSYMDYSNNWGSTRVNGNNQRNTASLRFTSGELQFTSIVTGEAILNNSMMAQLNQIININGVDISKFQIESSIGGTYYDPWEIQPVMTGYFQMRMSAAPTFEKHIIIAGGGGGSCANPNPNPTIVDYYFKLRENSSNATHNYSGYSGNYAEDYGALSSADLVVRVNQENNTIKLTSDAVRMNFSYFRQDPREYSRRVTEANAHGVASMRLGSSPGNSIQFDGRETTLDHSRMEVINSVLNTNKVEFYEATIISGFGITYYDPWEMTPVFMGYFDLKIYAGAEFVKHVVISGDSGGDCPEIIIENIININGGNGQPITIPKSHYNYHKPSTQLTSQPNDVGTSNLEGVKDTSNPSSLTGQFTNIPDSGILYIPTDGFQPITLIKNGHDSVILPSGTSDLSKAREVISNGNINTVFSLIDTSKHNIEGKKINDFSSLYSSCGSTQGVTCTVVDSSQGITDLNNFKITKPGRYLLVAFVKSSIGEQVLYKVIDARSQSDFNGLPIQNRMTTMVDNSTIREKNTQNSHTFSDMLFAFSGSSKEDSMKIPSINNTKTGNVAVGSTNKGIKVFDNKLKEVTLTGISTVGHVVTDVIEITGTPYIAFSSSNKGLTLVDTKNKKAMKVNGTLSENINSIVFSKNLIYCAFDNGVAVYYLDLGTQTIYERDHILSQEIFGTNERLGELNIISGKIIVNTHHTSPSNKMAIISKY